MRANDTNTPLGSLKTNWLRALTMALALCAVAIPATAAAKPGPVWGPSPDPESGAVQGPTPDRVLGYGGASPSTADPVQGPSPDRVLAYGGAPSSGNAGSPGAAPGSSIAVQPVADGGFDWLSAAIGCVAALAVSALVGIALLSARRRRIALPPGAPTS